MLEPQGMQVECVRSPQLVLEALGQSDYDVLLIDLNYTRDTTSGQEGLDLLARVQEMDTRLPVIVMTAWGNIDLAVESIKRGARDFIQKPWENERLLSLIRVHAELHQALRRARQLELENRLLRADGMPEFVADRALHAAGAGADCAGRAVGRQRAHHRRTRHRQGDRGQAAPRRFAALAHAAGGRECGRTAGRHVRERDLRPREGRIHRRAHRPHRPLRTGQRRHALSGRNRQCAPAPAGQAAAGAGDRRTGARGLIANAARGRARAFRNQCEPARGGDSGQLSRRPALPPQHGGDPPARLCATAAKTFRCWPRISSTSALALSQAGHRLLAGAPCSR